MSIRKLGVLAVLIAANTALLCQTIAYSHNAMSAHPEWVPAKQLMAAWVMGSDETVFERNLMNRNQLRLDGWYGFQQVHLADATGIREVEFRFDVAPEAYLAIEYARTATTVWGARLSRHEQFPSMRYRATLDGEFIERTPISVDLEGSHSGRLRLIDGQVALWLDGAPVFDVPAPRGTTSMLSFRSGRRAVAIDDVHAVRADGGVVIDEDFSFPISLPLVLGALLIALLVAVVPVAWGAVRRSLMRERILAAAALQVGLAMAVGTYAAVDYFVWSANYFVEGVTPTGRRIGGLRVDLESLRKKVFARYLFPFVSPPKPDYRAAAAELGYDADYDPYNRAPTNRVQVQRRPGELEHLPVDEVLERLREDPATHDGLKVVLLGGSQTWGAGAARDGDRLVFRLYEALGRDLERPVTVINGARTGAVVNGQRKRYQTLRPVEPDLVVLNVGNNDSLEGFEEDLRGLLEDVQASSKRTLLVLEPNAIDEAERPDNAGGRRELALKHEVMRTVGRQLQIPVLDLDAKMTTPPIVDSGFLWWDFVHLTSFGQRRAADAIAAAASDLLVKTSTPAVSAP